MVRGETYVQFADETGRSAEHLMNCKRVSESFAGEGFDRSLLPWSCFQELATPRLNQPQRKALLERAVVGDENGSWTRAKLREAINDLVGEPEKIDRASRNQGPLSFSSAKERDEYIRYRVEREREERHIERVASGLGRSTAFWIVLGDLFVWRASIIDGPPLGPAG